MTRPRECNGILNNILENRNVIARKTSGLTHEIMVFNAHGVKSNGIKSSLKNACAAIKLC